MIKLIKTFGVRYFFSRAWYELKKKTGILRQSFPREVSLPQTPSLDHWKKLDLPFFFRDRSDISVVKRPDPALQNHYQKIRAGRIQFFFRQWMTVEDWLRHPETGYKYDINKHWTQIPDLSSEAGDIKFVWEKARFSFLYDILRYDYHHDKDSSAFVFGQIVSWIDANPLNMGPHYICSQEISLRCLNWIFALHFYKNSPALTEAVWQKIIKSVYGQLRHVYANINFSRTFVRNNHAITETMMLFLGGLLFPFFPEADTWRIKGRKWLAEEIAYQVYEDGTFLQFSHNYQRVLTQLLTWTIVLAEKFGERLPPLIAEKAQKVAAYMYHCCVGNNGEMPNYGSNDGALFFKLTGCDYSDFRPSINALYRAVCGGHVYEDAAIREESEWYQGRVERTCIDGLHQREGKIFPQGGIYTWDDRDDNSFTFLKCTSYRDRPAQADNMHLDIWMNGINYFRDSGSYKYNTDEALIKYFAGTAGHNTVMIDDYDQMEKGSRFIWYSWPKNVYVDIEEEKDDWNLVAGAVMFDHVQSSITHQRTVIKKKGEPVWKIVDRIIGKPEKMKMRQLWHPHPEHLDEIEITAKDKNGAIIPRKEWQGWYSSYYGEKEAAPVWEFETSGEFIESIIVVRVSNDA